MNEGYDVVCASRFMPGGTMQGCPWLKGGAGAKGGIHAALCCLLPTKDPTSGFRMFSRRVIDQIAVEFDRAFVTALSFW